MGDTAGGKPEAKSALVALLPCLRWLGQYKREWLAPDLIAGVTLAAYNVPVALAYASLAGLPPQAGLYSCMFGGLAYAALGTSRQLAIGPTSSISMLIASALAALAAGDPSRQVLLAAATAILVAGVAAGAWCFRLGNAVSFVSESVLSGFKVGVGMLIAASQIPDLLGISSGGHNFFQKVVHIAEKFGESHIPSLALGLSALALLILGEKLMPGKPVVLLTVVLGIAAIALTGLGSCGIKVAGEIRPGLPAISLGGLTAKDIEALFPLALACFMLAFVEGISAARTFAMSHRYQIEPGQEIAAVGAANLAAGLFQGFPVAGGMSQTAVNDGSGAKTPAALAFASTAVGLVLLFLTGPFRYLPTPVLSAVVLLSVVGLIKPKDFIYFYRVSKFEFWVAAVALAGVLLLGILKGVMLAVIFSLLLILKRVAHPRVILLGRIPGTDYFGDAVRHPENEMIPGVLVARVEGQICYFNVDHVKASLLSLAEGSSPKATILVLEMLTTPDLDLTGARMLGELHGELASRGISLALAETTGVVRDMLRASGEETKFGRLQQDQTAWSLIRERRQDPAEPLLGI